MKLISLKKTSLAIPQDISQETDSQMLIRIGKKFAFIFLLLFMSDTLFDWVLGLLDLFVEGIHIVIESIEYSIELLLEYLIQTDHQHSEMIIVNGSILISLYLMYRLFKVIPVLYKKLLNKWTMYLSNQSSYWHALSLLRKSKIISAYSLGVSCLLFLVTL